VPARQQDVVEVPTVGAVLPAGELVVRLHGMSRVDGLHLRHGHQRRRRMGDPDEGSRITSAAGQEATGLAGQQRREVEGQPSGDDVPLRRHFGPRSVQLRAEERGETVPAQVAGVGDREPVLPAEVIGQRDEVVPRLGVPIRDRLGRQGPVRPVRVTVQASPPEAPRRSKGPRSPHPVDPGHRSRAHGIG
jgi:hypothetical protein